MNTSLGTWKPSLRLPITNSSTGPFQLFLFEHSNTNQPSPVDSTLVDNGSISEADMAPFTPNSPRHSWTAQDRIVVALLFVYYKCTSQEVAGIFNKICSDKISAEGFEDGISYSTIRSQLGDLRGEGSGNGLYIDIERSSFQHVRRKYRAQRELIEDAAQDLDIVLEIQIKSLRPVFTPASRKKRRVDERADTPATHVWVSDTTDEEIVNTPSKPPKKHFKRPAHIENRIPKVTAHLAPETPKTPNPAPFEIEDLASNHKVNLKPLRIEHDYNGEGSRRRPQFLFRAFTTSHGFTARKFLTSPNNIPSPPRIETEDFRLQADPHLRIDKTYQSPFISLAQNPKNALQEKRLPRGPNFSFAIFMYNDIERDLAMRFGPSKGLFLTTVVCHLHDINDLPRSPLTSSTPYTGRGEFLVWGSIECPPLAVLDVAQAMFLRIVLETTHSINYDSGFRLGRCLQMVPFEWRATVAYKLVCAYRIMDHRTAKSTLAGNTFFRGVEDAVVVEPRQPSVVTESEMNNSSDQPGNFLVATRDMWSPSPSVTPLPAARSASRNHEGVTSITQLTSITEEEFRFEDEPEDVMAPFTFDSQLPETNSSFTVPPDIDVGFRSEDEEPITEQVKQPNYITLRKPQRHSSPPRPRWSSSLENSYVSRTMTTLISEEQIEKETRSIVGKINQNAGYISDDSLIDSDDEDLEILTPSTSETVSPTQSQPTLNRNLRLKPSTVELFKQQLSHFAADKDSPFPPAFAPNPNESIHDSITPVITAKGSLKRPFDLTTAEDEDEDEQSQPAPLNSEDEYEEVIKSIQARRKSRAHNALSLRSRSTPPPAARKSGQSHV